MIVECAACGARHDVSGRPPGSRARCRCGSILELGTASSQAGALNCPRCGGAAATSDTRCRFCAIELLVRACPRCLTRIFHGYKHCPHCSAPTDLPAGAHPEKGRTCPQCSGTLLTRLVGDVALDDCPNCAGVYIDAIAIERLLADRQRSRAEAVLGVYPKREHQQTTARPHGKTYLRCPDCGTVMNRRQFARGAGVVVDVCRGHGTWFDPGELPVVVDFVMNGGLERAEKRELEEKREAARQLMAEAKAASARSSWQGTGQPVSRGSWGVDAGGALLDLLSSLWK